MLNRLTVSALLALATAPYSVCQDTATVQGRILDETGKPVNRVRVTLIKTTGVSRGAERRNGVSDNTGAYQVTGLAAGTYRVCAEAFGGDYLDPCRWSASAPETTVAAGQSRSGVNVSLAKGRAVRIRIADASGHIAKNEGRTRGANLLIGAWDRQGLFIRARPVSRGAKEHLFEVSLPLDTPVKLSVGSRFYRLKDGQGKDVALNGTNREVRVSTNGALTELTFSVSGTTKE